MPGPSRQLRRTCGGAVGIAADWHVTLVAADGTLEGVATLLDTGLVAGVLSKGGNRQEGQSERQSRVHSKDVYPSDASYDEVILSDIRKGLCWHVYTLYYRRDDYDGSREAECDRARVVCLLKAGVHVRML